MNFEIRPICVEDIAGFRAALDAVASERTYILTLQAPPLVRVAEFVRNNVANNYAQYVAAAEGEIIGWADIIPLQKESLQHIGSLGMAVVAGCRQQGIGRALLEKVVAHAWDSGLTRLELEVFTSNLPAVALYEKFGFEHEGIKRNARLIDGEYQDIHVMAQYRV